MNHLELWETAQRNDSLEEALDRHIRADRAALKSDLPWIVLIVAAIVIAGTLIVQVLG